MKLTLGNAPYYLQCVQFVGSRLTILAAQTMDRSNAKVGEGAKLLFLGWLAVKSLACSENV